MAIPKSKQQIKWGVTPEKYRPGSGFALQSFFAKIQGQKKDFRLNP
jgi:hypothetical protein